MVATAANIKTPALPATLDVKGQAMATPAGAVGIVGKLEGNELFVVRNGQTVSLKAGDWLLEGDRVVTSSAAERTLYFAGDAPGSLRSVRFARGADFKIRNGEIYTTSLMTSSMVTAAEALPSAPVAAGSDEPAEADAAMAVEETSTLSGLFAGPVAMGVGGALGIGGGALALASLVSNDSSDPAAPASTNTSPSTGNGEGAGENGENVGGNDGGGTDGGNTGGEPAPEGGAFSSGGAQLDALFADNPTGQTPPFSFADGAAMLEGALPVPLAAPAGNSASPAAPLTETLAPVTEAITGAIAGSVPSGTEGSPADTLAAIVSGGITTAIGSTPVADMLPTIPTPVAI